jgi:hypothetical protein
MPAGRLPAQSEGLRCLRLRLPLVPFSYISTSGFRSASVILSPFYSFHDFSSAVTQQIESTQFFYPILFQHNGAYKNFLRRARSLGR